MTPGADELVRLIDAALVKAAAVVDSCHNSPAWSVATLVEWSLQDARRRAVKLLGEIRR